MAFFTGQPASLGGLFGAASDRVAPAFQNNQMALMNAGSALLGGKGWGGAGQAFMQGSMLDQNQRRQASQDKMNNELFRQKQMLFDQSQADRKAAKETRNKTQAWIAQNLPNYADAPQEIQMTAIKSLFTGQKPTTDMQEYELAKSQGFDGTFMDYQTGLKKAGATNVTVGGGKYGTIPQGYELIESQDGARLQALPGGPADKTQKESAKAGQAEVASRVITDASKRALEAAKNRQFGGFGQGIVSMNPYSDSAEVNRQVDVLKSNARIENLNAMRAASPTGGALGNVTEKEGAMLAAKSGALDPSSPNFERDLLDYELTLLQVIHGPEAGMAIFQKNHAGMGGSGSATVDGYTIEQVD